MGTDLNVLYKGKNIGSIGRKNNFTFYGDSDLPDEDECHLRLDDARKHVVSTITGYASWLAAQDEGVPLTEHMDDIVSSIKDLLEYFEYEIDIASKNQLLRELTLQLDEDGNLTDEVIEIVDDLEVDRRELQEKKEHKAKAKYFEDLHQRIDKVNWDAVEHQTGNVDLDFEKDTLVGKEWEEREKILDDLEKGKIIDPKIGEK